MGEPQLDANGSVRINQMEHNQQAALWILFLSSATLLWIALTDLRHFKIRNESVIALAVLYFAFVFVSGQWPSAPWHVGFALLMLAGMLYLYATEKMGGGDLKLLSVAFLWTGPWLAAPFGVLMILFVLLHYFAAQYGWTASQQSSAGLRIPLAPSIAGALIGMFALGLITSQ